MEKTDSDVTKHHAWLGKLIAEDRTSDDSTCDLMLESEGKEFPVHKNIMMLVSKYFKKMFTIEMKEKYEGIVKMLQIPHQRLANLIEFIYSGRIKITEDNVTDILDDAEYTELEALKEICKTTLLEILSAENCLKLRAYAQRYNLDDVFVKTNQAIATSFAAVVRQEDFVQLGADDMSAVIDLRNKNCEESAFAGVLLWVNHNPLQREELFVNLFLKIDFSSTQTDFLQKVSEEDLVKNNLICANFLVKNVLKLAQLNVVSNTDKFLIIGGENSPTDCVAYNVITRQATNFPKLNTGREAATSVKVGSKVYVTGGWDDRGSIKYKGSGVHSSKSCEMLDLNEPTKWNAMPTMLEARHSCSSSYYEDHIYVTGSLYNGSSCEKFDIHNNKWIKMNEMLHARYGHGTVVCDGFIYCIGGWDGNKRLDSCERYDVKSEKWNEIGKLNQARQRLASVVLNGEIYAIGGYGDGQHLSAVERLNPGIGKWENIASLQQPRSHASACVVGNKIFVIGGYNGGNNLKSVEVYDPTSDVWTITFETEKPVYDATVVAI